MQLDLNLLTALDALLEEGSVGGAADRLYLSAPAMSRTLGRIRRVTGDEILVRTGRSMTATPYALAVREQVHVLVQEAQAVLTPERNLALDTLKRTFTLRCHDAVVTAVGAALVVAVRSQAPGVALRLLAEAPTDTNDLRHGQVDMEVTAAAPTAAEIRFETVGADRLVVALRPDHPLAHAPLTLERYAQADHVTVSRRGRLRDPIDEALAARRLRRRVVAAAPTSTSALHLVAHSDLIAVIPHAMCRATITTLGLRTLAVPLELTPVPIVLAWHQRYENDRAHAWLRAQLRTALEAVCPSGVEISATAAS